MNRRQFLSSIASVGVSAALPAKTLPIPEIPQPVYGVSPMMEVLNYIRYDIAKKIALTSEYQRAEYELIAFGQSMFDPAKALAEIGALDSPAPAWQDAKAGGDQIG